MGGGLIIKAHIEYDMMNRMITRFCTADLTKTQFITQTFKELENHDHPLGPMKICNTYILQRFFRLLNNNIQSTLVDTIKLKQVFQEVYKNKNSAITYSFRLIDLDGDGFITQAQFLDFIYNSFRGLIEIVYRLIKNTEDNQFVYSFREWVKSNDKKMVDKIVGVFREYRRSNEERWNYIQYKEWIFSGKNWTLDIEIEPHRYRTPLNILSLLGVDLDHLKKTHDN